MLGLFYLFIFFLICYRYFKLVGMDTPNKQKNIYIERDRNGLYGLYIGNLAPEINENDLRGLFISSGFIEVCKILKLNHHDKTNIAFIKFARHEEALAGLQKVNGTKFGGQILEVRPAYETNRRAPRFGKERSTSSESLKQGRLHRAATNTTMNRDNVEENSHETEKKTTNEVDKTTSLPPKESQVKLTNEAKSEMYLLPPASQDVRYNGNSSTCSTSSLESFSDKMPVKSSTFNKSLIPKPQGNSLREVGIAAHLDGLITTDTSSGQANIKSENKLTATNVSNNNLPAGGQLAQNVSKLNLGNDSKYQNGQLTQGHLSVSKWSVEEVVEFFHCQEECTESMVTFIKEQEIDGNALMLIEECSLLHFMKLGPALKFLHLREKLKN